MTKSFPFVIADEGSAVAIGGKFAHKVTLPVVKLAKLCLRVRIYFIIFFPLFASSFHPSLFSHRFTALCRAIGTSTCNIVVFELISSFNESRRFLLKNYREKCSQNYNEPDRRISRAGKLLLFCTIIARRGRLSAKVLSRPYLAPLKTTNSI